MTAKKGFVNMSTRRVNRTTSVALAVHFLRLGGRAVRYVAYVPSNVHPNIILHMFAFLCSLLPPTFVTDRLLPECYRC
jgi:hypothetical protein